MTLHTYLKPACLLLATALTYGCASVDQAAKFGSLQSHLKAGDFASATEEVTEYAAVDESGEPTELLWGLQAGALYRMKQCYERSNLFLDASENLMYQEDTKGTASSVIGEAGSIVVNDTILPYQQSHYDGIMANTYKALNFAAMNDVNNARIEWNRVDDRQRRAVEDFAKQIAKRKEDLRQEKQDKKASADLQDSFDESLKIVQAREGHDMSTWQPYEGYVNPFTTYMHGLYFMLNAQTESDYSRAYESLNRAYELSGSEIVKGDMIIARQLRDGLSINQVKPQVWVVFENGLSAHKEEFRVDLPIVFNVNSGRTTLYTGIALPTLVEREAAYSCISANGTASEVVGDMDRIIKAEFKAEYNYILMRELVRAIAKTAVQSELADVDPILGLTMGLMQAATTSADIRMWSALPKEFQVARIQRPEDGVVTLSAPETDQVMTVEIAPEKQFNLIYVKAISRNHQPVVEVISI